MNPGNLAADKGTEASPAPEGRLILYDFGQACELSAAQQEGILSTIESIVDLDASACVAAFEKLGCLREGADATALEAMVRKNFASGRIRSKASRASGGAAAEEGGAEKVSVGAVDVSEAAAASKERLGDFVMPAELAFVARALAQMEGVGKGLDPDFEFIASAAVAIPELRGAQAYLEGWVKKRARALAADIFKIKLK